jgi:hypothetical protein
MEQPLPNMQSSITPAIPGSTIAREAEWIGTPGQGIRSVRKAPFAEAVRQSMEIQLGQASQWFEVISRDSLGEVLRERDIQLLAAGKASPQPGELKGADAVVVISGYAYQFVAASLGYRSPAPHFYSAAHTPEDSTNTGDGLCGVNATTRGLREQHACR